MIEAFQATPAIPNAVVRLGGCDAGDHRPVAFVVLRRRVVVDEVVAGEQARSQIGVVEVDARVEDRDLDRGRAVTDVPGGRSPQRQQVLLLAREARIVRSRECIPDVVELDGSDRRLGFERLPRAYGISDVDE
jgi:hypothetical protein